MNRESKDLRRRPSELQGAAQPIAVTSEACLLSAGRLLTIHDPRNVMYAEGLSDIERLAERVISGGPIAPNPGHTLPDLIRGVDALGNKYDGAPWIPDVLAALKNPTRGGGR